MATRFESSGCTYEIINADKKEIALVGTSGLSGELEIRRKVFHMFKFYTVVSIKGYAGSFSAGYYPGGDRRRKYVESISVDGAGVICTGITKVIVPDTMKEIGDYAFYKCGVTSVILPDSVTKIGEKAFAYCKYLKELRLGKNISSFGLGAFLHCEAPVDLVIKEGIEELPHGFLEFYGLRSIVLPDSYQKIDHLCFIDCRNLETITLPRHAYLQIDDKYMPFRGCRKLKSINVAEDNKYYCSIDGVLYNKEIDTVIYCPEGKEGKIVLPKSVKQIYQKAFCNCSKITSVDIQGNVSWIKRCTFYDCFSMESITLPATLSIIDEKAFYGCGLKEITIPSGVHDIRKEAFKSCRHLKKVTICDGVSQIGDRMFSFCAFTTITLPPSIVTIGQYPFPESLKELNIMNIEGAVTFKKESYMDGSIENYTVIEEHNRYFAWKHHINYLGKPKQEAKSATSKKETKPVSAEPAVTSSAGGKTATYGIWKVCIYDDGKAEVYKNGELCPKSSPALREIAAEIGLEVNPEWRTSQLSRNVLKAMQ